MEGNSDCGPGMTERTLQSLATRCLPSTAAANEEELWVEADPMERDAPIFVFWDDLPDGET
jgi:hypothetical protein